MPDNNSPSNPSYWGNDGISILSAVRLGQPADRLFRVLSPSVEHSLGYIESAVRQGHPLVKLVVGEMGSGKTTLNKLFTQTAADAGAKIVGINLPYLPSVRELNIVSDMITPTQLLTACIEKIREQVTAGNTSIGAAISDAFQSHRICTAYQAIATYYSKVAKGAIAEDEVLTPEWLAQRLSEAIAVWLQGGRVGGLKDFVLQVAGHSQAFGNIAMSDAGTIFTGSLRLYRLLNVYPAWMLDEFESVGGLNVTKQQNHLGMYRDMVDMIYSVSWGTLMMFSTPDGVEVIRRYPALYDRLQGASDFLITSPTWETKQFSEWDSDALVSVFRSLYINAAGQGDYVANRVINNLAELDGGSFKAFASEIAEADTVLPRLRLKEFVFAIDRLAQGVDAFHTGLYAGTVNESDNNDIFSQFISQPEESAPAYDQSYFSVDDDEGDDTPWGNITDSSQDALPLPANGEPVGSEDKVLYPLDHDADGPMEPAEDDPEEIKLTGFIFAPRLTCRADEALERLGRTKDLSESSRVAACVSRCRDSGMTLKEIMCRRAGGILAPLHVIDYALDYRHLDLQSLLRGIPKDRFGSPFKPLLHNGMLLPGAPTTSNHLDVIFMRSVPNPDYEEAALLKKDQEVRLAALKENRDKQLITKEQYAAASNEKKIKLPNKLLWEEVNVRIDPFLSLGQLRHFIYCVTINAGFILGDRLVDQLVMEVMKERMGHEPVTSRNGIAFIRNDGLMRLWSRETYYADKVVTDDAEYADYISELDGDGLAAEAQVM